MVPSPTALRIFFEEHGYRVSVAGTVAAATEQAGAAMGGKQTQSAESAQRNQRPRWNLWTSCSWT